MRRGGNSIFQRRLKIPRTVPVILIWVLCCHFQSVSLAVTQHPAQDRFDFINNLFLLRPSLELPVSSDNIEMLKIPYQKLLTRVKKGDSEGEIEPLMLYVPTQRQKLKAMVAELAKPSKAGLLYSSFSKKLLQLPKEKLKLHKAKIALDINDFRNIHTDKLRTVLSKPHHSVLIDGLSLKKKTALKKELLSQLKMFMSKTDRQVVLRKIQSGRQLHIEQDLLPRFAKKMIRKYLVHRGPNCFHAALAFQGQRFTKSMFYNIKEEKGYHRAMVNYDELWRIINSSFYEVDPRASKLKYGDLLVYFDVPPNIHAHRETNFRWIRHTATYLFGPYTFSKGSKSPSTPYSIKTLGEEWKTWSGYSKNLGVRVYRRNSPKIKKRPPVDLTDWLY